MSAVKAFQPERWSPFNLGMLAIIVVLGAIAPFVGAAWIKQLTLLWIMVVLAYTWDVQGGQTGYNSFGNIVFFGVGMYVCAGLQIGLYTDLAAYNAAKGGTVLTLTDGQYYRGLVIGLLVGGIVPVIIALAIGAFILSLRGHYFAIGTLALGLTAAELASGWDLIGAGSGMVPPRFPGASGTQGLVYYFACFGLAIVTFLVLRWLYTTRFGLALNAIRDDEDKAEAMGIRTVRYKTVAWAISAFFLGICGGLLGNFLLFIDPRETAFSGPTYGVWMVLMVVLGGKGTFWGPFIGAVLFHVTKELFWSYLLGLQYIALGVLIVVIVVFFPEGIVGWFRREFPHWFGEKVDESDDGGGDGGRDPAERAPS